MTFQQIKAKGDRLYSNAKARSYDMAQDVQDIIASAAANADQTLRENCSIDATEWDRIAADSIGCLLCDKSLASPKVCAWFRSIGYRW